MIQAGHPYPPERLRLAFDDGEQEGRAGYQCREWPWNKGQLRAEYRNGHEFGRACRIGLYADRL